MDLNVTEYEPHIALFVPDHDPLLFYHLIIEFIKFHLSKGRSLYFEIHERFAAPVKNLLKENGFGGIKVRQDINGKDRMLKGCKQ